MQQRGGPLISRTLRGGVLRARCGVAGLAKAASLRCGPRLASHPAGPRRGPFGYFNSLLAGRALDRTLETLAEIDRGPWLTVNDEQFVVYRAFLGPLGQVSVAEHIVNGVSRSYLKFRDASQLSKAHTSTRGQREVARFSVA